MSKSSPPTLSTLRRRRLIVALAVFLIALISWWYYPSLISSLYLQAELRAHHGSVNAIAFSNDGRLLATAGSDGTIIIWSKNARAAKTLTSHSGSVESVAFAPDGHTLASGGDDGIVRFWNLETMRIASSIVAYDYGGILAVVFAPDGKVLATEGDLGIKLWNASSLELVAELDKFASAITSGIAFSPDGRILATAGFHDHYPALWDATTGNQVGKFTGEYVGYKYGSVAFSPDGSYLATGTRRGIVIIWDVEAQQQDVQWNAYLRALHGGLSFTRDGGAVATTVTALSGVSGVIPSEIGLWKTTDGKNILRLAMPRRITDSRAGADSATCIAINPNGSTLASGHANGILRLWKLPATTTEP